MSTPQLIMFDKPVTIEEAVARAPDQSQALPWGVQSMLGETVRHMVLLASSISEHYRYALGLSGGIAQYLYDQPKGAITNPDLFLRTVQVGSLIGHFDNLETHVIQEEIPEDQQCMMLLVINDDKLVVGYIVTKLREYGDHINVNNVLPESKAV